MTERPDQRVTVTLGEDEVRLSPPTSLAVRWDIIAYQHSNPNRAAAAALAACWRGKHRPKARYALHQHSVGLWGGAVMEELLDRGISFSEIVIAGSAALGVLAVDLVSAAEVEAAEDHFREGGEDGPVDPGHRE